MLQIQLLSSLKGTKFNLNSSNQRRAIEDRIIRPRYYKITITISLHLILCLAPYKLPVGLVANLTKILIERLHRQQYISKGCLQFYLRNTFLSGRLNDQYLLGCSVSRTFHENASTVRAFHCPLFITELALSFLRGYSHLLLSQYYLLLLIKVSRVNFSSSFRK